MSNIFEDIDQQVKNFELQTLHQYTTQFVGCSQVYEDLFNPTLGNYWRPFNQQDQTAIFHCLHTWLSSVKPTLWVALKRFKILDRFVALRLVEEEFCFDYFFPHSDHPRNLQSKLHHKSSNGLTSNIGPQRYWQCESIYLQFMHW